MLKKKHVKLKKIILKACMDGWHFIKKFRIICLYGWMAFYKKACNLACSINEEKPKGFFMFSPTYRLNIPFTSTHCQASSKHQDGALEATILKKEERAPKHT
jgi:hypothetical protein